MVYTPSEAAKAVGKTKTTILRAIRSGKISAEKDAHGRWRIEPSELHRIYPPGTYGPDHNGPDVPIRTSVSDTELVAAKAELAAARATISALESERDFLRADVEAWRGQAQRKLLTWRGLFGGDKAE